MGPPTLRLDVPDSGHGTQTQDGRQVNDRDQTGIPRGREYTDYRCEIRASAHYTATISKVPKKGLMANPLILLVSPAGIEPATY